MLANVKHLLHYACYCSWCRPLHVRSDNFNFNLDTLSSVESLLRVILYKENIIKMQAQLKFINWKELTIYVARCCFYVATQKTKFHNLKLQSSIWSFPKKKPACWQYDYLTGCMLSNWHQLCTYNRRLIYVMF